MPLKKDITKDKKIYKGQQILSSVLYKNSSGRVKLKSKGHFYFLLCAYVPRDKIKYDTEKYLCQLHNLDAMMGGMEKSDNELVKEYKNGDRASLEVLIARHLSSIYNFVRRFVGEHEADDVTQETFVRVWKHIGRYDETRNFRVWLFTIARRVAIDFTRKKKHAHFSIFDDENGESFDVEDLSELPHELFRRKEVVEALEALVSELPDDRKTIVILHDAEMLPFKDIADIMGRPINTVKSQYRRALMTLRKLIDDGNAPKL